MITQSVVIAGTPPIFAAPSATDTAEIGAVLIVKNGSGASITVTLVTPATLATGDPYPDKPYPISAGGERWIPVLPEYRSPTNSRFADLTISATGSVTAAVVRF
jgi:hypothetical protein